LSATQAAIVQPVAPVLAALGGVAFLAESSSPRLVIAALAVFIGVVLAASARKPDPRQIASDDSARDSPRKTPDFGN
jgi:drug/metabolite transporter (DMT)-like permease